MALVLGSSAQAASGPYPTSMFGAQTHMMSQTQFNSAYPVYWDPSYTLPVSKSSGARWIRDGISAYTFNPYASLVYLPANNQTQKNTVNIHRAFVDSTLTQYDVAQFKVILSVIALPPVSQSNIDANTSLLSWLQALLTAHPSIYAIEMHNEPSSTWTGTPQNYVSTYKPFADMSHQVRPDVKVLGCAGCSIFLKKSWVDQAIAAGMLSFVDGISLHAYNNGNVTPEGDHLYGHGTWEDSQVYQYNYFESQNPAGRPPLELHFTEFGYSSVLGSTDSVATDALQAAYLSRLFVQIQDLKASGIPLISAEWYDLKDDTDPSRDNPPNMQHNFGLYNVDMTNPKLAYAPYQRFIQYIQNNAEIKEAPGVSAVTDTNPTAVLFKSWQRGSDGATLVPFWRNDHTTSVTADFTGHMSVTMPSAAAAIAIKNVTTVQLCGMTKSIPFTVSGAVVTFSVSYNICASWAILQ